MEYYLATKRWKFTVHNNMDEPRSYAEWNKSDREHPFVLLVGMQTGAATVEAVWRYLKKSKIDLLFDPAIPRLGIYLKESKTWIWKNISTPVFIAVLFTIAKMWKQPKSPSIDEWIKQLWDIYTMEFYLAVKKKKILSFPALWMDLENIMLNEISQLEKVK